MPAGELAIGVNQPLVPFGMDEVQGIGIGDVLKVVGRAGLAGNEELPLADGIGMRVEAPVAAFRVVDILAVAVENRHPVHDRRGTNTWGVMLTAG